MKIIKTTVISIIFLIMAFSIYISYSYYNLNKFKQTINKSIQLRNEKKYNEAVESFLEAQKIASPNNIDAYIYIGNIYNKLFSIKYDKKNYSLALKYYNKALKINKKNGLLYYNLGHLYENNHEYDKAIDNYKKTIIYSPKKYNAYLNLGNLYYFHTKQIKKYFPKTKIDDLKTMGIKLLKKATEIEPNNPNAWYNLQGYYKTLGKKEYENFKLKYQKILDNAKGKYNKKILNNLRILD